MKNSAPKPLKSQAILAATAIGFAAILMWAFLALLSAKAGPVPPLQLAAISFAIGGVIGALSWLKRPQALQALKKCPARLWLLGIGCLFSYHVLYFAALQTAPVIEVSLIAYLWPLLMVVFSALLLGEKLRLHHIIGVVLGLLGAVLVITRGQGLAFTGGFQLGHGLALTCAVIWAFYSVMSRRFGAVPTDVIAGFCLASALLSLIAHVLFEVAVWPASSSAWVAVILLGAFPLGLAFYAWDFGVKRGDILVLAAMSYAAPLLSTLVLLVFGIAVFHWSLLLACLLITGGAVIAAKDLLKPKA